MAIKTYSKKKDGSTALTTNFTVREFACKDGSDTILIDTALPPYLQKIRDHFKVPVTITSGYRTVSHNKSVGGATNSLHTKGQAADIKVQGKSSTEVAKYAESLGIKGIMDYQTSKFTHIDTRANKYFAKVVNGKTTSVSAFGGSTSSSPGGSSVKAVQTKVNSLYSVGLATDGKYGSLTHTGIVKGLQTELNKQRGAKLVVDGKCGVKTIAACPTVRKGAQGNITRLIQYVLICKGYSLTADGKFGVKTEAAVKAFQNANGLTVDGVVGPKTFAKLFG